MKEIIMSLYFVINDFAFIFATVQSRSQSVEQGIIDLTYCFGDDL